jgi:hypothetical protein
MVNRRLIGETESRNVTCLLVSPWFGMTMSNRISDISLVPEHGTLFRHRRPQEYSTSPTTEDMLNCKRNLNF